MDHLAPDGEVVKMMGYKQEKGLDGPTIEAEGAFHFKSAWKERRNGAPEQAVSAIEEIVGGFARSVYTMSNAGTHGIKEREDVLGFVAT